MKLIDFILPEFRKENSSSDEKLETWDILFWVFIIFIIVALLLNT